MTTLRRGRHGGRPQRTTARHCRATRVANDSVSFDDGAALVADLLAPLVQSPELLALGLDLGTAMCGIHLGVLSGHSVSKYARFSSQSQRPETPTREAKCRQTSA
jgi:hypothetical protein